MTNAQLDQYVTIGWMILAGITFFGVLFRLALSAAPITQRILHGLIWFGTWVIAQLGMVIVVSLASYCENRLGKPATLGDMFSYLMIISPTLVAFALFLSTSPKENGNAS